MVVSSAAVIPLAVTGGAFNSPKPLSVSTGARTSGVAETCFVSCVASVSALPLDDTVASDTIRRIISTKRPEIGRFDQSVLAVTWNKTTQPSPRFSAVTSGVPSLRRAQVFMVGPMRAGSVRTCRVMSTSGGTGRPANRLSASNGASGWGVDHESAPPSVRPPSRSGAGRSSSE